MTEEVKKTLDAKQEARQNWADESDGDEDAAKEIGTSVGQERPDHKVIDPNMRKNVEPVVPKKDYGPPIQRERNSNGDFIVTKIMIPDLVVPVAVDEKNSDDSSEEESEEEASQVIEEIQEKKEVVKILSKKEQKKLEEAEFERVFKEMGIKEEEKKAEAAPVKKEEVVTDEKKHAANKKKKEKALAKKKAEESKKTEETKEEAPLDEAAKKAAIEEALKKRQAQASKGGSRKGPDLSAAAKAQAVRNKKNKQAQEAFDL